MSHQGITGLISQRKFSLNAYFWPVGIFNLSEYRDKSHNFTNLISVMSSLWNSILDTFTLDALCSQEQFLTLVLN